MKISDLKNTFTGMPFNEYRAKSGLNFHTLKDFCDNPFRFNDGWYADNVKESPALRLGTQFHELLLQGEEVFDQNNALWTPPTNPKTGEPFGSLTKAYKEAFAEFQTGSAGKLPYTSEERTVLQEMLEECQRNPAVQEVMRPFDAEGVGSEVMFQGELFPGLTVKGSIDRLDDQIGIIDLKTTSRLGKGFWRYDIYDWFYVEQLAFYQLALKEVCGAEEYPDAYIVAVETGNQFRSSVRRITEDVMSKARAYVLNGMICRYLNALHSRVFAGPDDVAEEITYYPAERMAIE